MIMLTLIEMESAHQRLRFGHFLKVSYFSNIFRKSTYAPQLYTELCIDDFLRGPSKLGEKFEVN